LINVNQRILSIIDSHPSARNLHKPCLRANASDFHQLKFLEGIVQTNFELPLARRVDQGSKCPTNVILPLCLSETLENLGGNFIAG
jgi:hypothetical protein